MYHRKFSMATYMRTIDKPSTTKPHPITLGLDSWLKSWFSLLVLRYADILRVSALLNAGHRPTHAGLRSKTRLLLTLLIVPHEKQLTSIVKLGKTVILAHQRQTGPETAAWLVRNVQRCAAVLSHIWPITATCELHQVAAVTCTCRVYNA